MKEIVGTAVNCSLHMQGEQIEPCLELVIITREVCYDLGVGNLIPRDNIEQFRVWMSAKELRSVVSSLIEYVKLSEGLLDKVNQAKPKQETLDIGGLSEAT